MAETIKYQKITSCFNLSQLRFQIAVIKMVVLHQRLVISINFLTQS